MRDDAVNDVIGDVARRITAETPPDAAAFRRRVLARIENGDAPRHTWRASFVLAPIAATAVIALALFAGREHKADPEKQAVNVVAAPTPLPGAAPSRVSDPEPGAGALAKDFLGAERRRPAPADAVAAAPTLDMDAVAAIDVAPLVVNTMAPEPIQIEQLETIAPIVVAPLDFTDEQRRDR
jgi:hypothetical protein